MNYWQSLVQLLFNLVLFTSALIWWQILSDPRACLRRLDSTASPRVAPAAGVVLLACLLWPVVPGIVFGIVSNQGGGQLQQAQGSFVGNLLIWSILVLGLRVQAGGDDTSPLRLSLRRADVRTGFLGFLVTVLPVFAVLLLTQHLRSEDSQHSFLTLVIEHPNLIVIGSVTLAAVVGAPLAEELVFRVILQGAIEQVRPVTAVVAVAVLFSAIHANSLARIPDALGLFPLAMVLGIVYQRTHSYPAVVIIHMLFNASNLAMALLTHDAASR